MKHNYFFHVTSSYYELLFCPLGCFRSFHFASQWLNFPPMSKNVEKEHEHYLIIEIVCVISDNIERKTILLLETSQLYLTAFFLMISIINIKVRI